MILHSTGLDIYEVLVANIPRGMDVYVSMPKITWNRKLQELVALHALVEATVEF